MRKIIKEKGSLYCTSNIWDVLQDTLLRINPSKIFILCDSTTETKCLPYLLTKLDSSIKPEILIIQEGETNKTIASCLEVWDQLSKRGADRKSLLINLGGGVVTDLGGFVASTFRRGIEFINIPTTLLAMVDASVGGKNGVDLGGLKNQIGCIRNPECVVIDITFLKTLPKEEITSGYAEMLKHGLIASEAYWNQLSSFSVINTSETEILIWDSIQIKNDIVTQDPTENGLRKTLNYGHTLGHAIESYFLTHKQSSSLLHGEAVAVGMILATYISSELLSFPKPKLEEISSTIFKHFSKVIFNDLDVEEIIKLLVYDKKNENGKVLFVLLKDFGKHKTDCEVPNDLIYKAFEYYKNFKKNI